MSSFHVSWLFAAAVLAALTACAGKATSLPVPAGKGQRMKVALLGDGPWSGILIDDRERYSLNRLQLVMWTILILSTFLGVLIDNIWSDPGKALAIPVELLGLMGISAGSAVVAGAVKAGKNANRPETITGGPTFHQRAALRAQNAAAAASGAAIGAAGGATAAEALVDALQEAMKLFPRGAGEAARAAAISAQVAASAARAAGQAAVAAPAAAAAIRAGEVAARVAEAKPQDPRFAQVFLEEEGTTGANQVVSVTKFQNFIFTLALGTVYTVLTAKAAGYPVFDQQVLWLIGISHAAYVGGKVPNKA